MASQQQNNLLSFLQRQTLFPQSAPPRRRSRSRRSLQSNSLKDRLTRFNNQVTYVPTEPSVSGPPSPTSVAFPSARTSLQTPFRQSPWRQENNYYLLYNDQTRQSSMTFRPEKVGTHNIYQQHKQVQMHQSVDQSRVLALTCLHSIEDRLKSRIADTNRHLDSFNRQVSAWITQQLKEAQQSIMDMVHLAFREQDRLVRQYVKEQQQTFHNNLRATKLLLQGQLKRVGELQKQLKSNHWRTTASEILNSNLQKRLETYLRQVSYIGPPPWSPKSFIKDHLQIIQLHLGEIFKLSTYAC